MQRIHTLGTLNPHGINECLTRTFNEPSVVPEPFCLFNNFFLTHLYPFISFCFLHTYLIALSCFSSVYNQFTSTKDNNPKRQFFSLWCIRYISCDAVIFFKIVEIIFVYFLNKTYYKLFCSQS